MTGIQDFRSLPLRPELATAMQRVESLGVSCELGLVQRHCQAEPLGLLRFGYIPFTGLLDLLISNFAGINEATEMSVHVPPSGTEFICTHRKYGIEFHTGHHSDRYSERDVLDRLVKHYGALSQMLAEALRDGEKLFFYRPEESVPGDDRPEELVEAMGAYGHPTLVWVDVSDDPEKIGRLEWVYPGRLIKAYLDYYAPVRLAAAASFTTWVRLVMGALQMKENAPASSTALQRAPIDLDVVKPHFFSFTQGLQAAAEAVAANRRETALAILTQLRWNFPARLEPYVHAAEILESLARYNDAELVVENGLRCTRPTVELLIHRARIAHALGRFSDAVRHWAEVLQKNPDHPEGYMGSAISLRSMKRFDDADKILAAALERFPDDSTVASQYAWHSQHLGDWPQAALRWETLRDRFPDHQDGYTAGAVALRETGNVQEAEALLHFAMARFPDDRGPVVEFAWLATAQHNWPEAARRWRCVRDDFPDFVESYLCEASVLKEMGQYEEAETLLREGTARFPQNASLTRELEHLRAQATA